MADDRFGNIKIDGGSPAGSKGVNGLLPEDRDDEVPDPSAQMEISNKETEKGSSRRTSQSSPKLRRPLPSGKMLAWLSLILLLVVLYGVGSYFFVPMVIKGLLVPKLSRQIDRPVEFGRIVFSPFNLELLVDDVTVGPIRGDKTGRVLLVSERASMQFSLARIFEGKIVCRQVVLDTIAMNLVRQKDRTVDLKWVSDFFLSNAGDREVQYWPAWFVIGEVTVNAGHIQVDDRQAKKIFNIEHIQLYFPDAGTRNRDKTALPKLSAVIDSSPFEINTVRFRNQSGAWRTGFSFAFKKVIMNNFKELFPLPDTGLQLSDGEADINLNIILPEKQHGFEGIIVEGEANLKAVRWHDPVAQTALALPEARIVYHVAHGDKLFRLTNVEFQGPELRLGGKENTATREPLASLAYLQSVLKKISSADEILEINNFLVNNGRIIISHGGPAHSKTELNDVAFSMSDFTTAGHRRVHQAGQAPAKYSFRAKDLSAKTAADFFAEGQLNEESVLNGKLKITNLNLAQYPNLLPKSAFGMQKGKADILLQYEYAGQTVKGSGNSAVRNIVYNGMIKTTGYVVTGKSKKALAGEMLTCRKFYFDMMSRTVVCNQLELHKSDIFTDRIFGLKTTKKASGSGNWQFKVNDLQVSDSTIHASMKGIAAAKKSSNLVLKNVDLKADSLQTEKVTDNVQASAGIGKKGKLSITGSYSSRTGQGTLLLDIQDLELSRLQPYFSSWFVPKVNKGSFGAKGSLHLPAKEFRGKVHIDDLDTGSRDGTGISLKQAFSENCTFRSNPLAVEIEELVVQHPSLKPGLSNGERTLDKYLRIKDGTLPPTVHIDKVRVEDGKYGMSEPIIYPAYQPLLKNINGTLSLADPTGQVFSFNGKINGQGNFTVLGIGLSGKLQSYELTVQDFPLLPFDSVLKEEAGFSGRQTIASWTQGMVSDENVSKIATKMTVRDVVPDNSISSTSILSLIVNKDHEFEMEMDGEYSTNRPQPFLLEQLIKRLHHLEVKAAISPHLVLQTTLPGLSLPGSIVFAPGLALLEESTSLSGYKALLQMRPFTSLGLQGQFDPVADTEVLRAELQEKTDREREVENTRRALAKVNIQQREKKRLKELKAGVPGVVTEEIMPSELTEDLQPLPRVEVQLDPSILRDLARQRARVLRDHLVNQLQLDPDRITLETDVMEGGSIVEIDVLPFMPPVNEKNNNDS